nr:tRNA lysidine(34) synthetase TilS [uncultured Anaeromusa sp.]
MLLSKVRSWCERRQLFPEQSLVLVACSGGPDSLALVHVLQRLALERGFRLAVAHVDHCFRGEASVADERFVAEFCRERQLSYQAVAIDVPGYLRENGGSPQDVARRLRYQWLRETASSLGAAYIALGHHADDQAETFLLHLLRGAGAEGLAAMAEQEALLVRPFLQVRRREIETYCSEQGLRPRLDASNLKDKYLRNRIRHHLLPDLNTYNSEIVPALTRTADIIREEHDFVRQEALKAQERCVLWRENFCQVRLLAFSEYHPAVQRELWRQVLEKKRGALTGICFVHVENLLKLASDGRLGAVQVLPGGWQVRKDYDSLVLEPLAADGKWQRQGTGWQCEVTVPSVAVLPDGSRLETSWLSFGDVAGAAVLSLAWGAVEPPLLLRFRQSGDVFRPVGMGGRKKLKKYLIDAKVPQAQRDQLPLLCDAQGILWVAGLRADERASGAGKQLYVRLQRETQ